MVSVARTAPARLPPSAVFNPQDSTTATMVATSGAAAVSASPHPHAGTPLARFMRDCTAGTIGGFVVVLVGHPFDTVKVRLQTQSSTNPLYTGVGDCLRKTWAQEGLGGLYKGVSSPLVGQMVFRAVHFAAAGQAQALFRSHDADGAPLPLTALQAYAAGAMAGAVVGIAECPIDLYKSQLQVQILRHQEHPEYKAPFTSLAGAVKRSIALNGARGPFQGFTATALRNIPGNAAYFGTFDVLRNADARWRGVPVTEVPYADLLAAGGTAGALFWFASYPIDVIKSAMQGDSMAVAERHYPSFVETAKILWKDGGVPRFYRGFDACLLRAIPANAAMFSTVATIQNILAKREAHRA